MAELRRVLACLTTADRMHLGSLTKGITATLVGALSEKGLMTFETTIGQTFPELSPKIAVGVFTNLGGDQQLRQAVARIAPRIAARFSADEKPGDRSRAQP